MINNNSIITEGVAGPSSRPGVTIAGDYLPLGTSQR